MIQLDWLCHLCIESTAQVTSIFDPQTLWLSEGGAILLSLFGTAVPVANKQSIFNRLFAQPNPEVKYLEDLTVLARHFEFIPPLVLTVLFIIQVRRVCDVGSA